LVQILVKIEFRQGSAVLRYIQLTELFHAGVRQNAARVIVAQNHPSGDPPLSPDELAVTIKIIEAGNPAAKTHILYNRCKKRFANRLVLLITVLDNLLGQTFIDRFRLVRNFFVLLLQPFVRRRNLSG